MKGGMSLEAALDCLGPVVSEAHRIELLNRQQFALQDG
jgi:hypothetical protein